MRLDDDSAAAVEARFDALFWRSVDLAVLPSPPKTPAEELIRREGDDPVHESEVIMGCRVDAVRDLLAFVFQAGPNPLAVAGHLFAAARCLHPALLDDVCREDIELLCSEGRWNVLGKLRRIYTRKF